MKRQRGRGRGGKPGGGGGGHNTNRAFESNGPDAIKVRGSASLVYEKYLEKARDASSSGDRVLAESYLQHAEHYFRVMRAMQPSFTPQQEQRYGQDFDGPSDDDEGAENEAEYAGPSEGGEEAAPAETRERDRDRDRDRDRGPRFDRGPRPERGPRPDRGDRPERGEGSERFDRPERADRPERPERPMRAEGDEGEGDFRRRRRRGRFRAEGGAENGDRPHEQDVNGLSEGFGDGPRPAFLAGE